MAEAERERGRHRGSPAPATPAVPRGDTPRTSPPRSAGQAFGAFHRGRSSQGKPGGPDGPTAPPTSAP
ncbi:hypothetical protein G3I54_06150 [Streptomyces sp. SID14515]|nr:hypothetical protein [Streptomyces sp. SID14515]